MQQQNKNWDVVLPPHVPIAVPRSLVESMQSNWWHAVINIQKLWEKSRGENAIIWILDTERTLTHPDLVDNFAPELSFDMTGNADAPEEGHGIHCAGIAAGVDNNTGVIGFAPAATVAVGKVLHNGRGAYSWIANAIRKVADMELTGKHEGKVKIISMSLGGSSPSNDLHNAIKYAISKGCIVTASAGNSGLSDNPVSYPGAYEEVITIGSVGRDLTPSYFTSPYPEVDLAAPGESILSTYKEGGYAYLSGTSMANPVVAGICAVLVSAYPQLDNQSKLEKYLEQYAKDIHETGEDDETGAGLPHASAYFDNEPDKGDDPKPEPPKPEPPEPEPDPDPTFPVRNIRVEFDGERWPMIWRAANESKNHKLIVRHIDVTLKTTVTGEKIAEWINEKFDGYFRNRGLVLLKDNDIIDAIYWTFKFLFLTELKDYQDTITINAVKVEGDNKRIFKDTSVLERNATERSAAQKPAIEFYPPEIFELALEQAA